MSSGARGFDTIVIGSGIGGLTAAAALAKCGRRVLVLEQHFQLGGLTQTFRRREYVFATGLHYIGGVGEAPGAENQFGRMLRWLTEGRLRFASLGSPYDIVRLPGFEFPIESPRAAYVERLKTAFPEETGVIDRYFTACDDTQKAILALFAAKAAPAPIAALVRWFNAKRIRRALGTTTEEAVRDVRDVLLAAVLAARWGDYGVPPARSPSGSTPWSQGVISAVPITRLAVRRSSPWRLGKRSVLPVANYAHEPPFLRSALLAGAYVACASKTARRSLHLSSSRQWARAIRSPRSPEKCRLNGAGTSRRSGPVCPT